MSAITILQNLPTDIKSQIDVTYGSWQELYVKIYSLSATNYELFKNKPLNYKFLRTEIENQLYEIENKLDSFNIDGQSIVTDISGDFTQTIVTSTIINLDNYLAQFGTSFNIMKDQLDKYLNK